MSLVIDEAENCRFDGLPGVQVQVRPPMKVEYRNFRLKHLSSGAANKTEKEKWI